MGSGDGSVVSTSVARTRDLGSDVAAGARGGDVYALVGELGSGKTEFVRGFVRHLDPSVRVRSPSFTILNVYQTAPFPVYHFDFFRLKDRSELTEVGVDEYLGSAGVCLIEWADMFLEELPGEATTVVRFEDRGGTRRAISIGPRGRDVRP
jgi:tRNA threonylcarbamoyladenosine biosynthesis protein TsaE